MSAGTRVQEICVTYLNEIQTLVPSNVERQDNFHPLTDDSHTKSGAVEVGEQELK